VLTGGGVCECSLQF